MGKQAKSKTPSAKLADKEAERLSTFRAQSRTTDALVDALLRKD